MEDPLHKKVKTLLKLNCSLETILKDNGEELALNSNDSSLFIKFTFAMAQLHRELSIGSQCLFPSIPKLHMLQHIAMQSGQINPGGRGVTNLKILWGFTDVWPRAVLQDSSLHRSLRRCYSKFEWLRHLQLSKNWEKGDSTWWAAALESCWAWKFMWILQSRSKSMWKLKVAVWGWALWGWALWGWHFGAGHFGAGHFGVGHFGAGHFVARCCEWKLHGGSKFCKKIHPKIYVLSSCILHHKKID